MRRWNVIILMFVALPAFAKKDKSNDYQMGTLSMLTLKSGWIDTTRCSGEIGDIECSGGIKDTYQNVYLLTLSDGTQTVIHHALGRPDTVKGLNLENGSDVKVMYRIQRVQGLVSVDYAVIPDANNSKKEGWYYFDGHFKKPTSKSATAPPPTNVSNVKAMCDSGRLSPELQKQYCK
jgi:hypothetical protein